MEYVQDRVIYWYMVKNYHVRVERQILRIDKGIPVRWFYIIKKEYKKHYIIKNVVVE